jgi:hypothetical protein
MLRRYSKAIISLRKKKLEFTYLIVIAMLYVIIIIVLRLRFLSVNNYTRHLYKVLWIAKTNCFVKLCLRTANVRGKGFVRLVLKYIKQAIISNNV